MVTNLKAYRYQHGTDETLDTAFDNSTFFGALKLGDGVIFWKTAFRWYAIELSQVERVFRRVEFKYGKLCAGGSCHHIESLVLVLKDGSELELFIGKNEFVDTIKKEAERLMLTLQTQHPELQYGKP